MPEGDSIVKLAHVLGPELEGVRLREVRIDGQEARDFEDVVLDEVWPVGKHLFLASDDLAIRSHLGMHGAWHRYYDGDTWELPRARASIVLTEHAEVDPCTWVLFRAKEVEVVDLSGARHHAFLRRLGPDLLGAHADDRWLDDVLTRVRSCRPDATLADILLDQRVAAGIGNVWKSELCFLEGVSPSMRACDVADATFERIYVRAREMLARNLGPAMRSTRGPAPHRAATHRPTDEERYWVYKRNDEPCSACGATIQYARTGFTPRATYWCPNCQ